MSDHTKLFERAAGSLRAARSSDGRSPEAPDRKRRNQRIAAGVVGLAIAIAVGWLGINAIRSTPPVPADEPTPTPARLGDLAYALNGDIFVAEWDGSNSVKIADGRPPDEWEDGVLVEEHCGPGEYSAEGPIWSPDGRYLAYRHMDCNAPAFQTPGSWWDVVISDAGGNVVTSFPSEGKGISWSPDSTRVAVWDHWARGTLTIGVYGLNGERQTLLTLPFVIPAGESDPVWSPDGRSLLLAQLRDPPRRKHTTATSVDRPRRRVAVDVFARWIACRLRHPQLARRCRCRRFQPSGGVRRSAREPRMVPSR